MMASGWARRVSGKCGTQPAEFQFRYGYRLRPGLRVQFRRMRDGRWETGIVRNVEPLRVDLW